MNDTHPEIAAMFRDLIMQKSGEQRLMMGFSMYDTAREIVRSAVYNTNPAITEKQMKKEIFLRFYAHQFNPAEIDRILRAL